MFFLKFWQHRRRLAGMLALVQGAVLCAGLAAPAQASENVPYVALTFDDGPSGRYTRRLLDGLYDRGVHATFLLCGYRLKDYPELAQRMVDEGHEIGLHGYSHKAMKDMSRRDIAAELTDTQALLPPDCQPVFVRPPGGLASDSVRQVAQVRRLALLHWSVDPKDWDCRDPGPVKERVLNNIQDGDIVLLHDLSASSVTAALEIVDTLLERGYQIVTVSQLAKVRNKSLTPGKTYSSFPPPNR